MSICPAESLRDARVIHALRPTPIAPHKITDQTLTIFGFAWWTLIPPAVLALGLWIHLMWKGFS